jgi:RNA-directed DNA polymerase
MRIDLKHFQFLKTVFARLRTKEEEVGIDLLAKALGVTIAKLKNIEIKYQVEFIDKKSGGKRRLDKPCDDLKKMQNRIYQILLKRIPNHPSCTGFLPKKSIVHNAQRHAGKSVIIKLDIENFFTNTSATRVKRYFIKLGWNEEASQILTKLTTYSEGLPQGAPTSPILSNLVNYSMDCGILALAKKYGFEYTRYADDITLSSDASENIKEVSKKIINKVKYVLKRKGYSLNKKKTRVFKHFQQQRVSGLIVNKTKDGNETVPRVPRKLKKLIRAVEYHKKYPERVKKPPKIKFTEAELNGYLGFIKMVERQSKTKE